MDKSSEKDIENKLRGILRSSSLIAPCLCDGNSLALDRRLHFLMKRAVVVGGVEAKTGIQKGQTPEIQQGRLSDYLQTRTFYSLNPDIMSE